MGIAYRKKETIYANWFLTSLQSFLVNSFNAIFESTNSVPFILVNFIWKPKAPSKVEAFLWLVANKKVNTNDLF